MERMDLILHNFAMLAKVPIDGRTYRKAAEAIEEALQERDAEWLAIVDGMIKESKYNGDLTKEARYAQASGLRELRARMTGDVQQ